MAMFETWRRRRLLGGAVLLAAVGFAAAAADRAGAEGASPHRAGATQVAQAAPAAGAKKRRPSAANAFNRLLKSPASKGNAPPSDDGIHDPANSGTDALQWPSEAFQDLPKSRDGNLVDWVKALGEGAIAPWVDLEDPEAEAMLFDLVIVREVKGSMPDVVYPHEQHTQWLDCENCHDDIFLPQKGANQISMAGILLGQKCGVCHGKVAFPVSDCRRCHARPKTPEQLKALAEKSTWRSVGKARTEAGTPPATNGKPGQQN
jgi:c(7)-type cytochrome triheme protein